jgi:high-affinity nickel-transport protein
MTFLPALALGFALGMRHATDADHISAVGTIASSGRSARRAAVVGAWWGLGHSASVLLVGGALVLLRLPMPVRVALALEFVVALMLIVLGVRALLARRDEVPASALRPLMIGVVHGLAGSAVLALLIVGTADSALIAAVYLVCFCIGSTAGMAAVSAMFVLPARVSAARAINLERVVRVAAGVASIGIGISIAHRVTVQDGLFAAVPSVTP